MTQRNRGLGLLAVALALAPSGCLSPKTTQTSVEAQLVGPDGTVTTSGAGGPCGAPSGGFGFCAAQSQTLRLGVSKIVNVALSAAPDFEGDVALTVERNALDLIDTRATITIQLSQTSLHLTPGSRTTIPVRVATDTLAPTVLGSLFHVVATRMGGPAATATIEVPLTVDPIYDVYLHGGAPEVWDANAVGTPARFAPHLGGLTINFHNLDTAATHIIHGNGIVTHQNTAQPLAKSPGGGADGGVYSIRLTQTTPQTGSFYCHVHENNGLARTVMINQ